MSWLTVIGLLAVAVWVVWAGATYLVRDLPTDRHRERMEALGRASRTRRD